MGITYTEIRDTFNALSKTANYLDKRWSEIETFLTGKKRFIFVGSGSSYSLAKSLAAICNMHSDAPATALAGGDIVLHAARYKNMVDGAVVVFISRSGKTTELIKALEALRAQGISFDVLSLLAAEDTPLGQLSDLALCTPWSFDESVCQTRSVTNFYFMGAYIWARAAKDQYTLDDLTYIIENSEEYMQKTEKLANELSTLGWNRAVVLADAELEGLAEEGALVFKEVCQLPANFYHVLDVRHGPIVLFGEQTLVLVAMGVGNELELNLLKDLNAKGAKVIAFSDEQIDTGDVQSHTYGKPLAHLAKGVPFILLCQLVAYEKSKVTGADPDKPTGLDPWIAL